MTSNPENVVSVRVEAGLGTPVGGWAPVTLWGQSDAYLKSQGFGDTPSDPIQRWNAEIDGVNNADPSGPDWYAAGKSKAERFERPGVVRVFCEIHSHMNAFILVFAHRFFTVTDADGRYKLENVPPGTYTLAVWNETVHGEPPRRSVTIADGGGDVDADFTIR